MPEQSTNGIRFYHDLRASGDRLILITGLGASSAAWDPKPVVALARRFILITFDNSADGRCDEPEEPYTLPLFAEDAAALLDHLKSGREHIFSVSMGAMIAQGVRPESSGARAHPEAWMYHGGWQECGTRSGAVIREPHRPRRSYSSAKLRRT